MLDRVPGSGTVVDVDVADALGRGPATDDDRDPGPTQPGGQRVGSVERDEHGPVAVAGAEVALDALLIGSRVRHEEDELHRLLGQRVADPAQDPREERVAEQLGARFGDDDGNGVAPPRHEASGRLIRHVPEAADGGLDGLARGWLTRRSPFTTRDAVARETRASRATCSRVTAPALPEFQVVRALSRSLGHSRRVRQESASHPRLGTLAICRSLIGQVRSGVGSAQLAFGPAASMLDRYPSSTFGANSPMFSVAVKGYGIVIWDGDGMWRTFVRHRVAERDPLGPRRDAPCEARARPRSRTVCAKRCSRCRARACSRRTVSTDRVNATENRAAPDLGDPS